MARGDSFQEAAAAGVTKTLLYAADALQGDLGETSSGSVSLLPQPVLEVVPAVLIRSLGLLGVSLTLAAVVGVLLGIFIAGKRSGISLLALLGSIAGVSIPSFFAALLLQLGVIKITQIYGKSILPVGGFGWDKHHHFTHARPGSPAFSPDHPGDLCHGGGYSLPGLCPDRSQQRIKVL